MPERGQDWDKTFFFDLDDRLEAFRGGELHCCQKLRGSLLITHVYSVISPCELELCFDCLLCVFYRRVNSIGSVSLKQTLVKKCRVWQGRVKWMWVTPPKLMSSHGCLHFLSLMVCSDYETVSFLKFGAVGDI